MTWTLYCNEEFSQNPWNLVCGGFCGHVVKFMLGSILLLGIIICWIVYNYIKFVSEDPVITCISRNTPIWTRTVPIVNGLSFFILLVSILWVSRSDYLKRKTVAILMVLAALTVVSSVTFIAFFSLTNETGMIVRDSSTSDLMYQFEFDGLRDQAYAIFLTSNEINLTYPNLTCSFAPITQLCSTSGWLLKEQIPGAYKCQPSSEEGVALCLNYFKGTAMYTYSAMCFYSLLIIFIGLGYTNTIARRMIAPELWCEKGCCLSKETVALIEKERGKIASIQEEEGEKSALIKEEEGEKSALIKKEEGEESALIKEQRVESTPIEGQREGYTPIEGQTEDDLLVI